MIKIDDVKRLSEPQPKCNTTVVGVDKKYDSHPHTHNIANMPQICEDKKVV